MNGFGEPGNGAFQLGNVSDGDEVDQLSFDVMIQCAPLRVRSIVVRFSDSSFESAQEKARATRS